MGHNGYCFGKVRTGTFVEGHMYYDHMVSESDSDKSAGAMRTTPTKVLEVLLDLPILRMAVESEAPMAICRLPRPNPRNLEIGHNRIWAEADKVDSKFSMTKDLVTLRRTFNKYWTVILTREEWGKNWPNRLRKASICNH